MILAILPLRLLLSTIHKPFCFVTPTKHCELEINKNLRVYLYPMMLSNRGKEKNLLSSRGCSMPLAVETWGFFS